MNDVKINIVGKFRKARSYSVSIPENWNETPSADRLFIARQLLRYADNVPIARGRILKHYLKKLPTRYRALISEVDLYELSGLLGWAKLDEMPVQPFEFKSSAWSLPGDLFENGYFYQYAKCSELADAFIKDPEAKAENINTIFATLTDKHKRPAITDDEIKAKARALRRVPAYKKILVFYYFLSVRKFVYQTFKDPLFNTDPDELEKGQAPAPTLGWWGVAMDISESRVFGSITDVYKYNFYDILAYMVKKTLERRKNKSTFETFSND